MILTDEQLDILKNRIESIGCKWIENKILNNVLVEYNFITVFENRKNLNGYSLIQKTYNNYSLKYFNNNTFVIDLCVKTIQNFINEIERQKKIEKILYKKKQLEKDFEKNN